MVYDYYTSIGQNCEAAFQIRRVLGFDDSSFFSWNVTTSKSFISIMNDNFSNILETSNLYFREGGSMVKDARYGYLFHSPFDLNSKEVGFDNSIMEGYRTKANYLVDKMRQNALKSRVLYIFKSKEADLKAKAVEMRDAIIKFSEGRDAFDLVVLQPQHKAEDDWGLDRIANRYLKRLAPRLDACDGHVSSWDKVFREFAHKKPLRFSGY